MYQYAQVIIDISLRKLDRPFTYRIPEVLQGQLRLGSLVLVPFGSGNTTRKGYVIAFAGSCDLPEEKVKDITGIAMQGSDETGGNAIRLAAWMQARYGGTMALCLKTVLTGRRQAKPVESKSVTLLLGEEEAKQRLAFYETKHQVARARLLQSLIDTPVQPWQLIIQKLHVPAATIRAMERQGILRIEVRESFRNPVALEQVEETHLTLSPEQQAIVDGVLADFYTLQREAVSSAREERAFPDGSTRPEAGELPGGERSGAEGTKRTAVPVVSLIHGITGSGKTEVYISIIERIVAEGRQAIMLIPEISLTYQTLLRFYRHFGERVSVMNSTLSEAEKSDQFERARRGEIDVIIGPRSALFTPFPHLGVIVMDEEHETSYKNESMPKYHARDVAQYLVRRHGAVLVLGSATPSVDSYDRARRGEYRLYTLKRRLTGGTLASVEVADMRSELRLGNRSMLSRRLADQIEDRLERGEQTMLFLNRRGFSGFALCRSCGFVPKCPHCSVSLSIHLGQTWAPALDAQEEQGTGRRLVCHYCGYEQPLPQTCPECGSACIDGMNAGTEQIQDMLQKVYPKARILRMDADTTRTKGSYEKILSAFANEEADILVGTQMIVKGHDFPNVTLVGALLADMSLFAQDYCASERTFQLLTQAAGRAGRGQRPGLVIIQTYEPSHYSIRHAAAQDYEGFYQEEASYRRLLGYPPAAHLLSVQITSRSEDHALLYAGRTRELLSRLTGSWEKPPLLIGPAAPAPAKLRDEYRFALYIKSEEYDKLITCKDGVEAAAARAGAADPGFDIRFQFDFDPVVGW